MNLRHFLSRIQLTCLVVITTGQVLMGQTDTPQIGYVYPAGGQQGTTFQITIGGKYLGEPATAIFSGAGVQAEFVNYIRPLNQGAFKELQNRMGELKKQKEAAVPPHNMRRRRRRGASPHWDTQWSPEDEAELNAIRQRLDTFSIRRSSVPALVETVTLQVTVDPDAAPGMYELRLLTESGLSNPLVFCVGQLPEVAEESARTLAERASQRRGGRGRKRQKSQGVAPGTHPINTDPESDTDITLPCLVNGQILPGDVDRYRFVARKGQQLVIDTHARQLIPYLSDAVPGWFQATLTLCDAQGKEVAYTDDYRFRPDPVLHYEIPIDGPYVLEVRDALYRGREDFVYRVALGELPFITGIFPLGGRVGVKTQLELTGWNLPQSSISIKPELQGIHSFSVIQDGLLSNTIPFSVDVLQNCRDKEPNNDTDHAQQVTFPSIINGRIDRTGDLDIFSFHGRAGREVVAQVKARRLDSPMDSLLKLTTETGEQLAMNDDWEDAAFGLNTHHADSRLHVTLPRDGLYYLTIGDVQQHGGDAYTYRLYLDTEHPDFELRVVPSSINARAGTTVPMTVHVLRRDGFDGEINLRLCNQASRFRLSGTKIPAGEKSIRVTLTIPTETSNRLQSLRMEGLATIKGRQVVRPVVPADDKMQAFINRHLVVAQDLKVAVSGSPRKTTFRVLDSGRIKIPMGGKVDIPVQVPQRSFFGEVQLELSEPPEGIHIAEVIQGRSQSTLVLSSDDGRVKPGLKGNLILNAYAVKKGGQSSKGKEQRKKQRILLSALPAIPFEVVQN